MGITFAPTPSTLTSVNLTKSISSENLSKSTSIVILLTISKQGIAPVKEVTITDVVSPMLTGEPRELFVNNMFQKRLTLLNNTDYFSYSVSPKNDLELSKDWTFPMPSAHVTYKLGNDTQLRLAQFEFTQSNTAFRTSYGYGLENGSVAIVRDNFVIHCH